MLQVQPETKSVTIATSDLRGSIQVGSTIMAYATDQLVNLGSALVKGIKQVKLSGHLALCLSASLQTLINTQCLLSACLAPTWRTKLCP